MRAIGPGKLAGVGLAPLNGGRRRLKARSVLCSPPQQGLRRDLRGRAGTVLRVCGGGGGAPCLSEVAAGESPEGKEGRKEGGGRLNSGRSGM